MLAIDDSLHNSLRADLAEDAKLTFTSLDNAVIGLQTESLEPAQAFETFNWTIEKLRHFAQVVEEMPLFLVLQRLESYLDEKRIPGEAEFTDITILLDIIRGLLDDEIDRNTDEHEFLRSLPTRRPADLDDIMHLDVEFLLVDSNKTTLRIVEKELHNCGYRVTGVQTAYMALMLAVRTRPDVIIASSVQEDWNGVSLACALKAVPETKSIPVAILTSHDPDHPSFADLPRDTPLIRKGSHFSSDLFEALSGFQIV